MRWNTPITTNTAVLLTKVMAVFVSMLTVAMVASLYLLPGAA